MILFCYIFRTLLHLLILWRSMKDALLFVDWMRVLAQHPHPTSNLLTSICEWIGLQWLIVYRPTSLESSDAPSEWSCSSLAFDCAFDFSLACSLLSLSSSSLSSAVIGGVPLPYKSSKNWIMYGIYNNVKLVILQLKMRFDVITGSSGFLVRRYVTNFSRISCTSTYLQLSC